MSTQEIGPAATTPTNRPVTPSIDSPLPLNSMHLFAAMLDAARNGCECTPCGVLRNAAETLTNSILASKPGGPSK